MSLLSYNTILESGPPIPIAWLRHCYYYIILQKSNTNINLALRHSGLPHSEEHHSTTQARRLAFLNTLFGENLARI